MADVVIIGMPASGKSTVGREVAARLGVPFHDSDTLVEERTGRLVREIFADQGEVVFRALEEEAIAYALMEPGVLSLGGGAVLSAATRAALAGVPVVWLEVSVANATRRAGMNQLRPLLLGDVRARMETLMAERRPLYEEVATHRVSTNRRSAAEVADRVVALLRGQESAAADPEDEETP